MPSRVGTRSSRAGLACRGERRGWCENATGRGCIHRLRQK